MAKYLIIDNYDSFTYNLHHYLEDILKQDVDVLRNDDARLDHLEAYSHLIFSPGPGLPEEAGKMNELILREAGRKKMLGICLGMQAMAVCHGGKLENLSQVVHGMPAVLSFRDENDALFQRIDTPIEVGRYHSWVVNPESVSSSFHLTSFTEDGLLMSFTHKELPMYGVQFHPESILTPQGKVLMENFTKI